MNPNRKRDLHRKLAMPPVPAPPAGLADRIKGDIPKQLRLDMEGERRRFARSLGVSLRVAASILILTIGAYAMLHVLSRGSEEKPAEALRQEVKTPARTSVAETTAPPAAVAAAPPPASAPNVVKKERGESRRKIEVAAKQEPPASAGQIAEEPQSQVADRAMQAPAARTAVAESIAVKNAVSGLTTEMTVSPISGRTMLRVSAGAPDAKIEVEGARKVAPDLYVVEGEVATIRVRSRLEGVIEHTVRRADARPWSAVSPRMRDEVTKAETPPPN